MNAEPDERLRQIILKNFERGTLYDAGSIEKIAKILTGRDFWNLVGSRCGLNVRDLRRNLDVNRNWPKEPSRVEARHQDSKPKQIYGEKSLIILAVML